MSLVRRRHRIGRQRRQSVIQITIRRVRRQSTWSPLRLIRDRYASSVIGGGKRANVVGKSTATTLTLERSSSVGLRQTWSKEVGRHLDRATLSKRHHSSMSCSTLRQQQCHVSYLSSWRRYKTNSQFYCLKVNIFFTSKSSNLVIRLICIAKNRTSSPKV